MYSGELEAQVKRKMLAILQDETSRLLNAGRDLSLAYELVSNGNALQTKFKEHCDSIDEMNRKVAREISEIGGMMISREDILRSIYLMSEIAGCLDGIAFRLSALKLDKDGKYGDDIYALIGMVVDELFKLNEITRAMSINSQSIVDLISDIQKLEKDIDLKYRELLLNIMNNTNDFKELLLLKDVLDSIENVADRCLEAADSFEIISLNM